MQEGVEYPVAQAEAEDTPQQSTLDAWAQMGGTVVVEDVTQEVALRRVLERRRREYPDLGDFADAYYHLTVNSDPAPMDAYLAKVTAVKNRNPKP